MIKVLATKYTRKQWGALILLGVIAVISYLATGRNEMLRIVALVAACKDMEPKPLLKTIFWITAIGCAIIVLLSLVGVAGVISVTDEFRVGKIETRYCFGMGHPNSFHGMIWVLITLGCYIYRQKLRMWHYVILFIANILIYLFTLSRTATLLTMMVIIAYVVLNVWKRLAEYKWYYILCTIGVVVCVLVTMFLTEYWADYDFIRVIDEKLSLRVTVVNVVENAKPSDWTLFGLQENDYFFDMGISRLFYWYGVIPAILYLLMNFHLLHIAYKNRNSFLSTIVLVSTVYTLVEAHLISDYLLRNYLFVMYGLSLTIPSEEKALKSEFYFWDIRLIKRG